MGSIIFKFKLSEDIGVVFHHLISWQVAEISNCWPINYLNPAACQSHKAALWRFHSTEILIRISLTPYDSQKIKAFKIIFLRKVSETGHFTAANELLLCFVVWPWVEKQKHMFPLVSTFPISNYLTNCRWLANIILKPVCHYIILMGKNVTNNQEQ